MGHRYATLDDAAIGDLLESLAGWRLSPDGKALQRSYTFETFAAAFGFMSDCAKLAESLDHHPDWCNSFRRVEVSLTTHATGGLTDRDAALARAMEAVFAAGD